MSVEDGNEAGAVGWFPQVSHLVDNDTIEKSPGFLRQLGVEADAGC